MKRVYQYTRSGLSWYSVTDEYLKTAGYLPTDEIILLAGWPVAEWPDAYARRWQTIDGDYLLVGED